MARTITLFLTTGPYAGENTHTTIRIAEAALEKGHRVNVIASADGVYAFLKGQKARGIANAEEEFSRLIGKGLTVFL
jgi:sulfur relay (sulfurtransferase) complex TusBCD TusD component (DsrE family)